MLKSPLSRLVGRAIVVGLAVFFGQLAAAQEPFSQSVLIAAATAAVTAALELLTPLNKSVGVGS